MSILPVLGHKPITSYFSRTSSTNRKRKKTEVSTFSSSKRPKQSTTAGPLFSDEPRTSGNRVVHGILPAITASSTPPPSRGLKPSETQGSAASFLVVPNVTDVASNMTIPSSQSQEASTIDTPSDFSKFSPLPSYTGSTKVDGLVIQSSQSQFLIMTSPNTRKLEVTPTLPALDVAIPSSQSQERELTIPAEDDMTTASSGTSLCGTTQESVESFQRTLSDESFSVPIQTSVSNFMASQAPDTGGDHTDLFPDPFGDGDFETERKVERSPAISQPSFLVGSYSSLPAEVLEFRNMFENGDESYPADFPESLR